MFAVCFMLVSCLAYYLILKMVLACSYEISVGFQRTLQNQIPEDRTPQMGWRLALLFTLFISVNSQLLYAKNVSFSDNTMMLRLRYWSIQKTVSEICSYHSTYLVHILSLGFLHILPCKYRQAYGPWSCNQHWVRSCTVLYTLLERMLCLLDSQYH
jgi:hypothetical protein